MEAQLRSVADQAVPFLMSPQLWAAMAAGFLALVTGLVERVVVFVEDLRAARIRHSVDTQRVSTDQRRQPCARRPCLRSATGRQRHVRPVEPDCARSVRESESRLVGGSDPSSPRRPLTFDLGVAHYESLLLTSEA